MLGDLHGKLAAVLNTEAQRTELAYESLANTKAAKETLRTINQQAIASARSRTAASLLVTMQEKWVEGSFKSGVLTCTEKKHLLKELHKLRASLLLKSVYFSYPSASRVLRWSRLFARCSEHTLRDFLHPEVIERRVYRKGQSLIKVDEPVDSLFIIYRGYAQMTLGSHTVSFVSISRFGDIYWIVSLRAGGLFDPRPDFGSHRSHLRSKRLRHHHGGARRPGGAVHSHSHAD